VFYYVAINIKRWLKLKNHISSIAKFGYWTNLIFITSHNEKNFCLIIKPTSFKNLMKVFMLGTTRMQWARCKALNIFMGVKVMPCMVLLQGWIEVNVSFISKHLKMEDVIYPQWAFFEHISRFFGGVFFVLCMVLHKIALCNYYIIYYLSTISNSTSLWRERMPPFAYISTGNNCNNIYFYYWKRCQNFYVNYVFIF